MRTLSFVLVFLLSYARLEAQVCELGLHGGWLAYSGDLQSGKLQTENAALGGGLFFRQRLNKAISWRIQTTIGQLRGDDSNPPDVLGELRNNNFEIEVGELSFFLEYDLLTLTHKYAPIRFTSYLIGGLGGLLFSNYNNPIAEFSRFQPVLPFGLGVKIYLNRHFSLFANTTLYTTFFDFLDNTSATGFTNKDYQYGDKYSTDTYYYAGISLSYAIYTLECPLPIKKGRK